MSRRPPLWERHVVEELQQLTSSLPAEHREPDRRPRALGLRGPDGLLEGVCEYYPARLLSDGVAVGSLHVLAVRSDVRGQGIGRSAVAHRLSVLAAQARAADARSLLVTSDVMPGNDAMETVLEASGFSPGTEGGAYRRWVTQIDPGTS